MEAIFSLSNLVAMPFWVLLIVLPRWRVTSRIIGSPWIAAPFAGIYAMLVLPRLPLLLPAVFRPELGGIAALLGTLDGATIAWVHFLAFDLLVGRWIYLD